jgi:hypothetical protein
VSKKWVAIRINILGITLFSYLFFCFRSFLLFFFEWIYCLNHCNSKLFIFYFKNSIWLVRSEAINCWLLFWLCWEAKREWETNKKSKFMKIDSQFKTSNGLILVNFFVVLIAQISFFFRNFCVFIFWMF